MIRIPFSPYDKVRFGVPWAGVVMGWMAVLPKDGVLRPPHSLCVLGNWQGTARLGGNVVIKSADADHGMYNFDTCPVCDVNEPGAVLRWGQRNRATGRTMNEGYGITTSRSTFKQVDRLTAWKWYVATTRSA